MSEKPTKSAKVDMNPLKDWVQCIRDHATDSFKNTYKTSPGKFYMKVGAVGVGAVVAADGVYNLVAGSQEDVEDRFLSEKTGRNYTRMLVGTTEVLTGASMVYLGICKGGIGKAAGAGG